MYKTVLLSLIFLLSGCKELSREYREFFHPKPQAYSANTPCNLAHTLTQIQQNNKVKLLKNAELGLIYFYQHNYNQAIKSLKYAHHQYESYEDIISFYDTPLLVSSIYKNEYLGEPYDKIFIHNYTALSYLFIGEVEKARIESQLATRFQNRANVSFEKYKKEYHDSSHQSTLSKYNFGRIEPQHHPYKNPFSDYVTALAFAENGNHQMARVHISNAIKYAPHSTILTQKYNQYLQKREINTVELFFDVGQSPLKSQERLPLDMGNGNSQMTYLPSFEIEESNISYIKIINGQNKEVARSSLLVDINGIKINEFKEKLPSWLSMISTQFVKDILYYSAETQSSWIELLLKGFIATQSQRSQATWVTLPEKRLVASFVPKKDEKYTMVIISKKNKELDRKPLDIISTTNTKNIYRHFVLKKEHFCQSHKPTKEKK